MLAFYLCTLLSQVVLTNGLTTIGVSMFAMSATPSLPTFLSTIVIPSTITSIGI